MLYTIGLQQGEGNRVQMEKPLTHQCLALSGEGGEGVILATW